jgi:hypothetical protein
MTLKRAFILAGIIACAVIYCLPTHAEDARCKAPPYGMSVSDFQAFVKTFGHLVAVSRTLPPLCNAKYGGGDRTGLYNLGFTDQQIDSKDMGDLALDLLDALKNLADKIK